MLTMKTQGVEFSIAGGVEEIVRDPDPVPFFFFFSLFVFHFFIFIFFNFFFSMCFVLFVI